MQKEDHPYDLLCLVGGSPIYCAVQHCHLQITAVLCAVVSQYNHRYYTLRTGLEADHVRPSTAYIFHVAFLVVRRGVRRANRNAKRREERRAETVRDGSLWSFVAKVCLPVS